MRRIKIGDYVLASKWSDNDLHDPWRIGYVCRIIKDKRGTTYIVGEESGAWSDKRQYNYAKKITPEQAKERFNDYNVILNEITQNT